MNTSKLARTTFVLDRETADQLGYVAKRMGVSRSSLVRETLAEPVAMMAHWVRSVPAEVGPEDLARLGKMMGSDLDAFIDRKMADVGAGHE